MSQDFLDQLDDDLGDVFFGEDDFTEAATYTPVTGSAYDLNVLWDDPYEAAAPFSEMGKVQTRSISVRVKESNIVGGVKKGDRLTVRNATYKVITGEGDGLGVMVLTLHLV